MVIKVEYSGRGTIGSLDDIDYAEGFAAGKALYKEIGDAEYPHSLSDYPCSPWYAGYVDGYNQTHENN